MISAVERMYAKKALELDPGNIWYIMMLAGIYYQQKNLDSAIIYYEKAVKYYPEKENLKLMLGNLYSEDSRFDKADALFDSLDKKYGVNEASTLANIKNMMKAGRYDEARDLLMKLLNENPDEILYNGLLAEIYRGKGESREVQPRFHPDGIRLKDEEGKTVFSCTFRARKIDPGAKIVRAAPVGTARRWVTCRRPSWFSLDYIDVVGLKLAGNEPTFQGDTKGASSHPSQQSAIWCVRLGKPEIGGAGAASEKGNELDRGGEFSLRRVSGVDPMGEHVRLGRGSRCRDSKAGESGLRKMPVNRDRVR